jgi:alpha-1,2-mannosyltransferase
VHKRTGADGTAVLHRPLRATERMIRGRQGQVAPLLSAPTRSGLATAAERFFLAFVPAALVIGLVLTRYAIGKHLGFDYKPLWEASRQILQGASPYPAPHASALQGEQQFVYPPLAALLAAPLAAFPFGVAAALLAALELLATGLTLRVLGVRDWRCYGVALLWYPVIQNLLIGSITSLLALGLAVVWRYRDERRVAAPVTAVLIGAKVFLWPLLFWLAATRRGLAGLRAVALVLAAVAVSWALIGFAGLASYPRLLDQLSRLEEWKSYSAVAFGLVLGLSSGEARTLAIAAGAVILLGVIAVGRRRLRDADADRHAFILAIAAAFVLSPIVWTHYLALLLVPIAITRRTLSPLWFLPLAMWATPGQSDGRPWRVILGLSVWVLVLGASWRPTSSLTAFRSRPEAVPTA